jgi:secondary thiamine-phosphate synthase enzyme
MNTTTFPFSDKNPTLEEAPSLVCRGEIKIFGAVVDWTTTERMEILNVTERVQEVIGRSSICNGFVHLQTLHTTTALFINEWQQALLDDIKTHLSQMVLREMDWRHNNPRYSDCDRRNADSHLRGMLLGQSLTVQIRNSVLLLGTWQRILFAEFDGPRNRSVSVQVFGI